jgi:selenide,water dikinase
LQQLPNITDTNLLVGASSNDDAAVYKIKHDTAIVSTVDFFPPIVDDPFQFGEISAANSLSDIYAMGALPLIALNIVSFPDNLDISILGSILKGGASKSAEANVIIAGGHTVVDSEPKYGLSVTGIVTPGKEVTNIGAEVGDLLILTKPIGTGIITTAAKQDKAPKEIIENAVKIMLQLNKYASESMVKIGVNACTDITGFGLLGHINEMVSSNKVQFRIEKSKIPVINGATELIRQGTIPGGTLRNLEYINPMIDWGTNIKQDEKVLLSDAQTSGGLLISIPASKSGLLLEDLKTKGIISAIIGEVIPKSTNHKIIIS